MCQHFGFHHTKICRSWDGDWLTSLPLYISLVTGDVHSLYLSGGGTLFAGKEVEDWESAGAITLSVGYQYQSPGGFFVRPLFALLADGTVSLLWPGLTIGGSF